MKSKILKAIRRNQLGLLYAATIEKSLMEAMVGEKIAVTPPFKTKLTAWLEQASSFSLEAPLLDEEMDDIKHSARLMANHNILRLPYRYIYCECRLPMMGELALVAGPPVTIPTDDEYDLGNWPGDPKIGVSKGSPAETSEDERLKALRRKQIRWAGYVFCREHDRIDPMDWRVVPAVVEFNAIASPWVLIMQAYERWIAPDVAANMEWACKQANKMLLATLVLLNTRGMPIDVQRINQKLDLAERDKPENTHKIVRVIKAREESTRNARDEFGVPDSRLKMRLHRRRGHMRHQHFGRRNKNTKLIWIDECLVGHESEGRITHDYEVHDELDGHIPTDIDLNAEPEERAKP